MEKIITVLFKDGTEKFWYCSELYIKDTVIFVEDDEEIFGLPLSDIKAYNINKNIFK